MPPLPGGSDNPNIVAMENTEGPRTRAEAITLIFTNLTTKGWGKGNHDPIRQVEQFWTEDGRLVAENDPFIYSEWFLSEVRKAYNEYDRVIDKVFGVALDLSDPGAFVIGLVNTAVELKQDSDRFAAENEDLKAENEKLVAENKDLLQKLSPAICDSHSFEEDEEALHEESGEREDKVIFALSRKDGSEDEIVAVFKAPNPQVCERLWGIIQRAVLDTIKDGKNPDPERFNIPEGVAVGEFKTLYGYLGHFVDGVLDCVSPHKFNKTLG